MKIFNMLYRFKWEKKNLNKSIALTHFVDTVPSEWLQHFKNHETIGDLLFNLLYLSLGKNISYETWRDIMSFLDYKQLAQ